MPKANITNTFARKAKCENGKVKTDYFDIKEIGLMLEVRNTGRKTFYYRHTINRKVKQRKLSDSTSITANEARTLVQKLKKESNKDKCISLVSKSSVVTLESFFIEKYVPYIKTSKKTHKDDVCFFKHHILPFWGKLPMHKITTQMISDKHLSLKRTNKLASSTCNKLLHYLSKCYNTAIDWDIDGITINPVSKVKLFKEDNIVERFLTKQETKRLILTLDLQTKPQIKYIILFLLLTGARKSEVLNAKWKDIDLTNNLWTIPLSKNNKVRRVPISPKLNTVIHSIPKSKTYLFPSQITNKPLITIQYQWEKIRREAKLEDVRLHDLRHTFASNLVNSGISIYEVKELLGHSNVSVTQRYAHLSNKSLYDAVCSAARSIK